MFARWVDPNVRSSVALGVVLLCMAGLVLAKGHPLRAESRPPPGQTASLVPFDWLGLRGGDGVIRASEFEGHGLEGRVALSHGRLLAGGRQELFAEVTLTAQRLPGAPWRAPVSFVLVLDTSGSMAGRKLADARSAALRMLDQMHEDDEVAVVKFASTAQVPVELTPLKTGRWSARHAIERMQAGGNTDIANALLRAAGLLRTSHDRGQRIVIVTDGCDTSGAPRFAAADVATRQSAIGITVSALGIGNDYDDAYLGNLASAGRGNYEFLRDSSALARFIDKELRETAHTTARQTELELQLPPAARVRHVSGATWASTADAARLSFGSLFAGDERRAIISLELETGAAGSWLEFGGQMSWELVGGGRERARLSSLRVEIVTDPVAVERARDHAVLGSVASVAASQDELAAARAFARGEEARALELNRRSQAQLAEASRSAPPRVAKRLQAQQRAYARDAQTYRSQKPSPAAARSIGAREHKNLDRAVGF